MEVSIEDSVDLAAIIVLYRWLVILFIRIRDGLYGVVVLHCVFVEFVLKGR